MNETANYEETTPIRYRNGIMVLGTQQESWPCESHLEQNFRDDDLVVITPLQRHKLRYVIREQ